MALKAYIQTATRALLEDRVGHRKINLSTVFTGQYVGVREVTDEVWHVSFEL
jgi:hypothetical protein